MKTNLHSTARGKRIRGAQWLILGHKFTFNFTAQAMSIRSFVQYVRCLCVSVCWNNNFRTKWSSAYILSTMVLLVYIWIKFVDQGHGSKFNVTGRRNFLFRFTVNLGNQFQQRGRKVDVNWKLQISNARHKMVGATVSEGFSSSKFQSTSESAENFARWQSYASEL